MSTQVYLKNFENSSILVEVTRGEMVESVHRGIAVICDANGGVVKSWGDIGRPIYPRSAIKPLQAISVVESGAVEALALGSVEIALCCASHQGEPRHVDAVMGWLDRLGLEINDLECGPQMPLNEKASRALIRNGLYPTPAHNNCSGKHLGMLTTAIQINEPVKGYIDHNHKVQTRIYRLIQEMIGLDLSKAAKGIDGCGIPVFGIPLISVAIAMAKLGDPSKMSQSRAAACHQIIKACAANPLIISGTGTFNSLVLSKTGESCLLKSGAEGVYAAALPKLGLGICLKIDDGSGRAASAAMLKLLDVLGVVDASTVEFINKNTVSDINNWSGKIVGRIRPASTLLF